MSVVTIDKLYSHYEVISNAITNQKLSDCVKQYEDIIETGSKGVEKDKLLAVQFLAKFFKYFPSHQYQAIEALFDACEDDNMSIRKQAMKVLPSICQGAKEHTLKVADILSQLLQLEDSQEHAIAVASLCEVIKVDPMMALKGFFKQTSAGEDIVHEKCIKFLVQKFPSLLSGFPKEVEDYVFSEVKKIVEVCTSEDFVSLMEYLASTRFVSTPAGQMEYVQICVEQAELTNRFEPTEVDKIIACVNMALPYFSSQISSGKFLIYICDQILPFWEQIKTLDEREDQVLLRLLQQLAQMSLYCGQLEKPVEQVQNIFEILKAYMPLPPENVEVNTLPFQQFTFVECLIYTFHQLARQCPEYLTENPALLKDFRIRLQYFSRGLQGCIKTLNEGKSTEDTEAKKNAIKVTSNINTLIKDLFYTPPNYKSVVKLSFVTVKKQETVKQESKQTPTKRHAPITFDFDKGSTGNSKQRKNTENVKIYTPPSGKFSNNFQNQNRKPGRGRSRGGFGKNRGGSRGNWRK